MVAVGETLVEPLFGSEPVHPPLAAQLVAFVLDQLKVDALPDIMDVGFAVRVTVGGAGFTVTEAAACAEPPAPEQVST